MSFSWPPKNTSQGVKWGLGVVQKQTRAKMSVNSKTWTNMAKNGPTIFKAKHTPPEGGVRTKKCYITFDTIFGHYLPRGTIIDGSRKCRMGAFCTIAKNSGEMLKKGLKTGQNGVKIFFSPHTN